MIHIYPKGANSNKLVLFQLFFGRLGNVLILNIIFVLFMEISAQKWKKISKA